MCKNASGQKGPLHREYILVGGWVASGRCSAGWRRMALRGRPRVGAQPAGGGKLCEGACGRLAGGWFAGGWLAGGRPARRLARRWGWQRLATATGVGRWRSAAAGGGQRLKERLLAKQPLDSGFEWPTAVGGWRRPAVERAAVGEAAVGWWI